MPTFDLDPLYALIRKLDPEDPQRTLIASASPLLLAMHLEDEIEAYDHIKLLDSYILALHNLCLYPDGPGPEPEVWVRRYEGRGPWDMMGVGYDVAVSKKAYEQAEMVFIRPGSYEPLTKHTKGLFDPRKVDNADKVVLRLAIAMPPRHGKSMLVTEHLPLWFMLRYPDNTAVVSTYNTTFAEKWGKALQDKIEEKGSRLPIAADGKPLKPLVSTLSVTKFRPGKDRGEVNFRGFGGTLTGTGWGLGVIDDPFKDQEDALSETIRQAKRDWYSSTFRKRRTRRVGAPPPVEVMMFTRWHEEDLAGSFAYEEGDVDSPKQGWCVLRLPALAEVDDPLGRPVGASLCPQLRSQEDLLDEQREDPLWFSALNQGRPTHAQGTMFAKTQDQPDGTVSYWHWRESDDSYMCGDRALRKDQLMYYLTSDWATSKRSSADFSVLSLWGWHPTEKVLVLVDFIRDRVSTEGHLAWSAAFWDKYKFLDPMFLGIENKTFGTGLMNEMRRDRPDIITIPLKADKDKISRATPYANAVKAGRVWFPAPGAVGDMVSWENEHVLFPNAKHDDMVDTGGYAWYKAQDYAYTPQNEDQPGPPPLTHVEKGLRTIARSSRGSHPYEDLADIMRRFG